jgi:hypothetical protein
MFRGLTLVVLLAAPVFAAGAPDAGPLFQAIQKNDIAAVKRLLKDANA